jgi:hypothetical protein
MNRCRAELNEMTAMFDPKPGELYEDYDAAIREMRRCKDIESALAAKPSEDDIWLN